MKPSDDDIRPEYDFSRGVRNRYASRLAKDSNMTALDSDVTVLLDSASVSEGTAVTEIIQSQRWPTKA